MKSCAIEIVFKSHEPLHSILGTICSSKVKFFRSFYGRIEDTKKTFRL